MLLQFLLARERQPALEACEGRERMLVERGVRVGDGGVLPQLLQVREPLTALGALDRPRRRGGEVRRCTHWERKIPTRY